MDQQTMAPVHAPAQIEPPPKRFSSDAKEAWASAPEALRSEVLRMEKELTAGFKKHRAAALRDAELAKFHERAAKGGTTVKEALSRYVCFEDILRSDIITGLELVCQNAGTSLRDIAARVLGHTQTDSTTEAVTKFAAEQPRFDELADDIAFFLESGRADDLAEAYDLAERFKSLAGADVVA
jgi:hypothetical protein